MERTLVPVPVLKKVSPSPSRSATLSAVNADDGICRARANHVFLNVLTGGGFGYSRVRSRRSFKELQEKENEMVEMVI